MITDFRETLEIVKNSTCLLSYSYCWIKEDLALTEDEDSLPAPPVEIDFNTHYDLTLEEVKRMLEDFTSTADEYNDAIQKLLDTGKVRIVSEY